jgi:hypothetical protein
MRGFLRVGTQHRPFNPQQTGGARIRVLRKAMNMAWTPEKLNNLLLAAGAYAIQEAVVHHVSMLDAGQCTAEECVERLLEDQIDAMRFIIGERRATRLRQEIERSLETWDDD